MRRNSGMSLVELLVVLAVMGIAVAASALYLRPMEAPLQTAATELEGFFREVRGRALATTSAYRVAAVTPETARAEFAANCAASTWTTDPELELELPSEVAMADDTWAVCFNSRGLADINLVVDLDHDRSGTLQVEVLRGGASRVVP